MRNLTQGQVSAKAESEQSDCEFQLNEDPKYLRKVIAQLIDKSKTVLSTLELTTSRLEQMEAQRNYWKMRCLSRQEGGYTNQPRKVKIQSSICGKQGESRHVLRELTWNTQKAQNTDSKRNKSETFDSEDFKKFRMRSEKSVATVSLLDTTKKNKNPKKINVFFQADKGKHV